LRLNDINALNLCAMANMHGGRLERADQLLSAASYRLPANTAIRENLALVRERLAKSEKTV
jgi:Flp pilus assembly protein TadD